MAASRKVLISALQRIAETVQDDSLSAYTACERTLKLVSAVLDPAEMPAICAGRTPQGRWINAFYDAGVRSANITSWL